jgi:hypothetical protein
VRAVVCSGPPLAQFDGGPRRLYREAVLNTEEAPPRAMGRAIYQVRLKVRPEEEQAFNEWYEGTYIPKLLRETPHFTAARRYEGILDGEKVYITEYETTTETMAQAIAEMRAPARAADNKAFYQWRDRAITLHESVQFHERFRSDPQGRANDEVQMTNDG